MAQQLITDLWRVGKHRQAKKETLQAVESVHVVGAICRLAALPLELRIRALQQLEDVDLLSCTQTNTSFRNLTREVLLKRHRMVRKSAHRTAIRLDGQKPFRYTLMLLESGEAIVNARDAIEVFCHTPLLLTAFHKEACSFLQIHKVASFALKYSPFHDLQFDNQDQSMFALLAVLKCLGPSCESIDISPSSSAAKSAPPLSESFSLRQTFLSHVDCGLTSLESHSFQALESLTCPIAMVAGPNLVNRLMPLLECSGLRSLTILHGHDITSDDAEQFFNSLHIPQVTSLSVFSSAASPLALPEQMFKHNLNIKSCTFLHKPPRGRLSSYLSQPEECKLHLRLPPSLTAVTISPNYDRWEITTPLKNLSNLTVCSYVADPEDAMYCKLLKALIMTVSRANTRHLRPDFCLSMSFPVCFIMHIACRLQENGSQIPPCTCMDAPLASKLQILHGFRYLQIQDLSVKVTEAEQLNLFLSRWLRHFPDLLVLDIKLSNRFLMFPDSVLYVVVRNILEASPLLQCVRIAGSCLRIQDGIWKQITPVCWPPHLLASPAFGEYGS